MREIIRYIKKDDMKSYATYVLVNHCMPTLLKVKPSNIVNLNKRYVINKYEFIRLIEDEIQPFHSKYTILYENDTMIILLIYNQDLLHRVLISRENQLSLNSIGYVYQFENSVEETIEIIIKKLQQQYQKYKVRSAEFPHEIGIILGYPLRDVEEYIKNNGRNYILSGSWKVYYDTENAIKIFDSYNRIRDNAIKVIIAGQNLRDVMKL